MDPSEVACLRRPILGQTYRSADSANSNIVILFGGMHGGLACEVHVDSWMEYAWLGETMSTFVHTAIETLNGRTQEADTAVHGPRTARNPRAA
jgi:hypothetical protein